MMNWDDITARERDALVAQAMGITLPSVEECLAEATRVWQVQPGCRVFLLGFRAWPDDDGLPVFDGYTLPRYTEDLGAAWQVGSQFPAWGVEHLPDAPYGDRRRFCGWVITSDGVKFSNHEGHPAMAICRAFLRAKGVEVRRAHDHSR